MAEVALDIGGRRYAVSCKDGGEAHLREIAAQVDARAADALRAVGAATESRTLLLAALLLADDLHEARAGRIPDVDPTLARTLAALAERVEKLADGLETEVERP